MPAEKLTIEQAIEFYTLGSAYAEYAETNKGSIATGKLADLVVLSHDLFSIPKSDILKTNVDLTILGGQIIFDRFKA